MLTKALIKYYTYILSVQKCHIDSDYTIHGLWVDYARGGYPQFCSKKPFNISDLAPILPKLNTNWKSCWGNNEELWKHEWDKHATCMGSHLTVPQYFNLTLQLFDELSPFSSCNKKECLIQVDVELRFT